MSHPATQQAAAPGQQAKKQQELSAKNGIGISWTGASSY